MYQIDQNPYLPFRYYLLQEKSNQTRPRTMLI